MSANLVEAPRYNISYATSANLVATAKRWKHAMHTTAIATGELTSVDGLKHHATTYHMPHQQIWSLPLNAGNTLCTQQRSLQES
ncbi:hypothetical protein F511_12665 [Dorcoceras hygrometricum]|uniref:Uncharacterized protein n=1 Tax=Dorcoceras hygrometricum TaxID=472368 RepID=A0A2Z7CGR3_9LAMI|nr:hypothetical protein F511_12665 [Dorcoceras hygrometricum]